MSVRSEIDEAFAHRGDPIFLGNHQGDDIRLGIAMIDGVPTICDQDRRKVHGLASWYYGGWDHGDEDRTLTVVMSVRPEDWAEMVRIVEAHAESIQAAAEGA